MDHTLIKEKVILSALSTLRETSRLYTEKRKKKPLLDDDTNSIVYMQVQLKKIPATKNVKRIKIKLPHSLVDDNTDICFITGDLDKKNRKAEIEPDKLHYKELLNNLDINNITEVITLRELRTEYKPFEAKSKLLAAYDVFLADSKIIECLPRILGKHFYKKRKFPLSIDMKPSTLKKQVEKALSTKVFCVSGHGNACTSEVAKLNMDDKEIVDNVYAFLQSLFEHLPGSFNNVMGLYLKTKKSKALPIYISFGNPNKVFLPKEKEDSDFEMDDLTTLPKHYVKVYRDGTINVVKNPNSKEESDTDDDMGDIIAELEQSFDSQKMKQSKDWCHDSKRREMIAVTESTVSDYQQPEELKITKETRRNKKQKEIKSDENLIPGPGKPEEIEDSCKLVTKHKKREANKSEKVVKGTKRKSQTTLIDQDETVSLNIAKKKLEIDEMALGVNVKTSNLQRGAGENVFIEKKRTKTKSGQLEKASKLGKMKKGTKNDAKLRKFSEKKQLVKSKGGKKEKKKMC